jgi:hypothetical protein
MSDVTESEKLADWDGLEQTLRAAQLWDDPVATLFRELRSHAIVEHCPASKRPFASAAPQDLPQLIRAAADVPAVQRREIIAKLQASRVVDLVAALHDQLVMEAVIDPAHTLFGLRERPSTAFQLTLREAVAAILTWRQRNIELVRAVNQRSPKRLKWPPDRLQIAGLCASNLDVLSFINGLAEQMEKRACAMWRDLAKVLYVPRSATVSEEESAGDWSEADQQDLLDFLHWLTIVLYRLRVEFWSIQNQWRHSAGSELLVNYIEPSLFQTAAIAFLRRRFGDVFREMPCPDGPSDPELASAKILGAWKRQTRRFLEIVRVVEVFVTQWKRLDVEQTTMPPDYLKMARKHLEDLLDTLKNLYRLHRLAESCAAPATTTPTGRPGTPVIGLEAMHVRVLCEQARPTTVFQAHYFPSHTNLVRGVFWQLEDQLGEEPPEIITIVRHHTKGAPCIGEWTVIPLQRLFHPESRIVLFADWLAAKADVMLYDWESACVDCRLNERMAEIRQQRIDPLVLLTIAERKDRRVNSVFLFPDVPAIRDLFARDELAPFDDELRKLLSECAVQVNSAELVCLPWDSLGEDEDEGHEGTDDDWGL